MARVTLADVAAHVGVSVMTVSNVVNGRLGRVSAPTAARVQDAVTALGYVPHGAARSLAARRTHLVGLLLPTRGTSLLGSPHDQTLVGALEVTLRRRDHHLLLRGVETAADVRDSVQRWSLDGIVVLGFTDDELAALDLPRGVPTVVVDAHDDAPGRGHVRSDDHEGGRLAGAHLAALGHRDVVLVGPLAGGSRVVATRLDGLRQGLGVGHVPAVDAATTYDAGVATAPRVLRDHPGATAVVATADTLAAGLCRGLADAGRRVPGDLSVVGYDDAELARCVTPALTTVRQDVARKGEAAARLLLAAIGGAPGPRTEHVHVDLVVRASTAAPPS